jgi:hypothetical protein
MIKRKLFWAVFFFLIALIIVFLMCSYSYFNNTVPQQKSRTLYFQNTVFKDNYNSTFSMDVKFTSEKFDFFVREKIHVTVSIHRIYNNSIFPLSSIFFVLVTTEGHFMPSQNSSGLKVLDSLYPDIYYLEYDAYLDFSTKYSCRLLLFYFNTTNYTIIEDEQFVGPILEVQPVSVELQSRWNELQYDAMNKTIALSSIVIVFTLVIILMTWIDKYDSLYQVFKKMIQKWKRKIRGKS